MRVLCLYNKYSQLPAWAKRYEEASPDFVYRHIEPGKTYVVYAMESYSGLLLLRTDSGTHTAPSLLFQVVDGRLSRYWKLKVEEAEMATDWTIGFPEYVERRDYVSKLVDGDMEALVIFERWKQLLDVEASEDDSVL